MKQSEILTPTSSRWDEFVDCLEAAVSRGGCNGGWITLHGKEVLANPDRVHLYAQGIMRRMGDVDIPGTIAFFEAHGGYCDCEILLNVDPW